MGHHQPPHPQVATATTQALSGIEWVTYDTVAACHDHKSDSASAKKHSPASTPSPTTTTPHEQQPSEPYSPKPSHPNPLSPQHADAYA
jgi:hypothetical protein